MQVVSVHFPRGEDPGCSSDFGIALIWEEVKSLRMDGPCQDRDPELVSGSLPLPVYGSNLPNVHLLPGALPLCPSFSHSWASPRLILAGAWQ